MPKFVHAFVRIAARTIYFHVYLGTPYVLDFVRDVVTPRPPSIRIAVFKGLIKR